MAKEPFDDILEKIADMLSMIQKNQSKSFPEGELSPTVEKALDQIESYMAAYKSLTQEALKSAGISDEELKSRLASKKDLPEEKQKFVDRSEKLKTDVRGLENVYLMYKQALEMKKRKGPKKEKFGESRKKKFKRLSGGDKGWMPL